MNLHYTEIDALIERTEATYKTQAPGTPGRLLKIWNIARPILRIISHLFFVPKKWSNAIEYLIEEIDILAQGTQLKTGL